MSSLQIFRLASRTQPRRYLQSQFSPRRSPITPPIVLRAPLAAYSSSSTADQDQSKDKQADQVEQAPAVKGAHDSETFEEFTDRYEKEFDGVRDVFELQRNLNNAFAYDLVPSPVVVVAALRAARRVNDFPTAVRIFEGIKAKVENKGQYDEYLRELKPIREELGVNLFEDLYPSGWPWVDAGVWI